MADKALRRQEAGARKIDLPERKKKHQYDDQISLKGRRFVPEKY